ncbi:MAG: phosphatase PAP2 family protein [Spirochaetes bacterium]|nr:phosphatase PAP2 family protein [Spirochaetota bacterium]
MKKCALLLLFFTLGFNLWSQSVFTWDLRKDIIIGTAAVGLFFGHRLLSTEPSIPGYRNVRDLNFLDRGLLFENDLRHLDPARAAIQFSFFALPMVLTPLTVVGLDFSDGVIPWFLRGFDTWLVYGIMFTQAGFLMEGIRGIIKGTANRFRPPVYIMGGSQTHAFSTDSFPSGSTMLAFTPAAFLSTTFSAEHPDSPWRLPIVIGSYLLATSIGVQRVLSGEHFFTDVLAGAALGTLIGWGIPTLHRRTNGNDNNGISFMPTGNGIIVSVSLGGR